MSKKEEKKSEVLEQDTNKAGKSIPNPTGAARRRLLRAIGGSGSVAVGAIMTSQWQKPVIEAVLLPAHAQTSTDTGPVVNCPITVNVGSFTQSNTQLYTLSVYVSNSGGTTVMNEITGSGSGATSMSGSSTFPVGAYQAGLLVSLASADATYGYAFTASCCSASLNLGAGGVGQTFGNTLSLVIPDDGQCSFVR